MRELKHEGDGRRETLERMIGDLRRICIVFGGHWIEPAEKKEREKEKEKEEHQEENKELRVVRRSLMKLSTYVRERVSETRKVSAVEWEEGIYMMCRLQTD